MKQKRSILIEVCVAENPMHPRDVAIMAKHIEEFLEEILGEEDVLRVEYFEDYWGNLYD